MGGENSEKHIPNAETNVLKFNSSFGYSLQLKKIKVVIYYNIFNYNQ